MVFGKLTGTASARQQASRPASQQPALLACGPRPSSPDPYATSPFHHLQASVSHPGPAIPMGQLATSERPCVKAGESLRAADQVGRSGAAVLACARMMDSRR